MGDWELAERGARLMLEHDPAYAGTHYALALAAAHRGDGDAARSEFELALKYWSRADADLPEVVDVRARLAKTRGAGRSGNAAVTDRRP